MDFDLRLMSVSHILENHPVLEESIEYKIKYLDILEHFVIEYSKNNKFAKEVLENYKDRFLGKDLSKQKRRKKMKNTKFKAFKHKYIFFCDCLFINSMLDYNKANKILKEIKSMYSKSYDKNFDLLLYILYKNKKSIYGLKLNNNYIKYWKINKNYLKQKEYTILVTANMSAGKSTLINAIVGKKVNKTMHESCTSKLHYIYDKAFEDGLSYKLDGELNLNVNEDILLNNKIDNTDNKIFISTYFKLLASKSSRMCIIDTPGVNSALDKEHKDVTDGLILAQEYDKVLYVINSQNLGSCDDLSHLKFVCSNISENKIIFILNKLDKFKEPEDSIQESIDNLRGDLIKLGIKKPVICPISAYVGMLAKKKLFGDNLNEDEEEEYIFLNRKFNKENYNLSKFYSDEILKKINYADVENNSSIKLLLNCGILCLEEMIVEEVENNERDIY